MTREEAVKYFERKIRNFEKSMGAADRRGDDGAVAYLMEQEDMTWMP